MTNAMDPTRIDWSTKPGQLIAANSDIPPDIIFKFADNSNTEVKAHKLILAMVSNVFKNMFYVHNTADRTAKEILMQDATPLAFQVMVDAIYEVNPMKESLKEKSVDEIFAVLYLVTKYEISELVLAVKECLSSFPITENTIMEVADAAVEYLTTFEEETKDLLLTCAKFIKPKFPDAESLLRFVAENGDKMATVHRLAVLMKDLPSPTPCSNCKKEPCLNGMVVEAGQFRVGLKLTNNPADSGWSTELKNFTCEIIQILDSFKVESRVEYMFKTSEKINTGVIKYQMYQNGTPRFIFQCR